MKTGEFRITEFLNRSGTKSFRVTGHLNNQRIRENFAEQAEAITRKQTLEREALNLGPGLAVTTRLTTEQAQEAEAVFRLLSNRFSLTEAVNFALANYRPAEKAITVERALELFTADKRAANLRPATLAKLAIRLAAFKRKHGAEMVATVAAENVKALIFREASGNANRLTDYRTFSNFFNWAKAQGYIAESPLARITPPRTDASEPVAMSLAETRALLVAASNYNEGALVPYVALGLFAALRPEEIARISWEDVKLAQRVVILGPHVTKTRTRRVVDLSVNAVAWLTPFVLAKPPFQTTNFRKDWERVRAAAGWMSEAKPWVPDIMRHTGISYHYAKENHEGKTAAWAGNSPDMIHKHYRALVTPQDAIDFWSIFPDGWQAKPEPALLAKSKKA